MPSWHTWKINAVVPLPFSSAFSWAAVGFGEWDAEVRLRPDFLAWPLAGSSVFHTLCGCLPGSAAALRSCPAP